MSCVEMTKAQSGLWENKSESKGDIIDLCRCRSGSSIISKVPAGTVSTFAAISNALRSPSDSSAILYFGPFSLQATISSFFWIEILIGILESRSSSFITQLSQPSK